MIYCVYEHWLDKKCIYVGSGKILRAFNFGGMKNIIILF